MTTTPLQPEGEPTLSDVIRSLNKIEEDLGEMQSRMSSYEATAEKAREWEDRTWGTVKWVITLTTGLSVTAIFALFTLTLRALFTGS
ncbi:MAG: hypothetical protein AAFQ63_12190 [Cyanobacteria bacterium J06621_11]